MACHRPGSRHRHPRGNHGDSRFVAGASLITNNKHQQPIKPKQLMNTLKALAVVIVAIVTNWGGYIYASAPPDTGGPSRYERGEDTLRSSEIPARSICSLGSFHAPRQFLGTAAEISARSAYAHLVQRYESGRHISIRSLSAVQQCNRHAAEYASGRMFFNPHKMGCERGVPTVVLFHQPWSICQRDEECNVVCVAEIYNDSSHLTTRKEVRHA